MMIVQDDRKPLLVDKPAHVLRFHQVGEMRIAVVVMTSINMVQPGHRRYFVRSADVGMIPFCQKIHPVRIGENEKEDDIVQCPERFCVLGCHEVISKLEVMLSRCTFGGMESAIDVDYRFPFLRKFLGRLG